MNSDGLAIEGAEARGAEGPLRFANGRLTVYDAIGLGGMAAVHLGRLRDLDGTTTVAVKRPHAHLVNKPAFVAMLVDEARLTLRLRHPNIVQTLEVILEASELLLVMEYIRGESLAHLLENPAIKGVGMPPKIAAAIVVGIAEGLHAAHETRSERGELLGIVHRDVSPQNILVGTDGCARVLDFGIAKAAERVQTTREGQLKGNLRYTAPERLESTVFDRRADVFSLGLVLWECLTGRRLIDDESDGPAVRRLLAGEFAPPSAHVVVPDGLDRIVAHALSRAPDDRPPTAASFADELRAATTVATSTELAEWLSSTAATSLAERERVIRTIEASDASEARSLSSPSPIRSKLTPRHVRSALLGLAAAVVLAGGAGSLLFLRPAPRADRDAPTLTPSTPAEPGLGSAAESPAESPPPPPADSRAETAGSAEPRETGSSARRRSHPPPTSKPRVSCSPPHFIDSRGIQHFKPECLHK